jgi:hypothetical protein
VVFLRAYERVRGVADLRPQIRLRFKVATHTRDGIEVESLVFTLFTLGQLPEVLKVTYEGDPIPDNIRVISIYHAEVPIPGTDGKQRLVQRVNVLLDDLDPDDKREIHRNVQKFKNNPVEKIPGEKIYESSQTGPFLFDAHRVFDAIASKPYDVDEREIKEWTELPAHAAAGLFRNLVSQEYYDNLYKPSDPQEYPISELKQRFSKHMRNQGVLAYQYFENSDGSPIQVGQDWVVGEMDSMPVRDLRTPKLLRARGIKVIAAGFGELTPTHEDVSQYLTRYWQSEWQREEMIQQSEFELEAMRIRNMARLDAQTDIVNSLTMILKDSTYSREALAFRALQALERAAADPKMRGLLPEETIRMMERIHDLLLTGPESSLGDGFTDGRTSHPEGADGSQADGDRSGQEKEPPSVNAAGGYTGGSQTSGPNIQDVGSEQADSTQAANSEAGESEEDTNKSADEPEG